jgi:hypothetical protein
MGKYVKSTFHEKENRASVILERIHTDMCGPFSIASTTKHRYYVIFVDDFCSVPKAEPHCKPCFEKEL